MVRTAKELENTFKLVGIARKGRPEYADDDGYWTGGNCNWGGYHSLGQDCRTLASGLNKVESLNGQAIHNELTKCTTKQEFDSKKSTLLMKANEAISGLRPRTGYSSSMFGICIIWADEANNKLVETEMENGRKELAEAKAIIERTDYSWAEELKRVQFEIDQIEARMEENKRKAVKEKDPSKKAALLLAIENDGKLLQTKYEERSKYTNRFKHIDPSKYVSKMIERMKQAIEKSNRDGSGSGEDGGREDPNKPKKPNTPNSPFGDNNNKNNKNNTQPDNNNSNRNLRSKNQPEQNNQQMLIIGVVVLVVLFLLMNQKEQPRGRYDEYDYY